MESDRDYSRQIHSIDRMLKELGNCTEMLDTTLQQSKMKRGQVGNAWQGEPVPSEGETKPRVSERVRFYNTQGSPMGTPMKRAGSFDEGEMRFHQQAALNHAKLGRALSAGQAEMNEALAFRKPMYSSQKTPSPVGTPGRGRQSPSSAFSGGSAGSLTNNYDGRTANTLPNGITSVAQVYSERSASPSQQRNGAIYQQRSASPNQQRSTLPNAQAFGSPNQQRSGLANQGRIGSPHLQRSASPNQQRSGLANQQRIGSPNQQRSASPNQQWSPLDQPRYPSPNGEAGSTDQQKFSPYNQQLLSSSNQQWSPSANQQMSGVAASSQPGQRSQIPNSITTVAQIHHPRSRSPGEAGLRTPSPGGSSGGRRSPNAPKVVMLSERSSTPDSLVCEAPKVYTGPPEPPLSPTLYATTQTTPKLFNAATHIHTDGPRKPLIGRDVYHPASSWQGAKDYSSPKVTDQVNGKPLMDLTNSDINNNQDGSPPEEQHSAENGLDERPVQGTVASKIAYLTDIYNTEKTPGHHHPCRGTVVPLPGLSNVSPTDVSKEIAEYNAKALAPGELSHCADTLYVSGALPQRIVDRTPGRVVVGEPCTFVLDEFEQRVLARNKAGELSPSSSMDVNSIDAEVGGNADADDVSALSSDGHADSAFGGSSSVSTPVAGHSSNRFIPVLSATTSNGEARSISPTSSPRSSLDELARSAQEAREDEESGYARLEDVRPAKTDLGIQNAQSQPVPQESAYRPGSNVSSGTQNTLQGSHSGTPTIFDSRENVQHEVQTDLEAIDVILSEMNELSLKESPPASPVLSHKDAALSSTGSPQSLRSTYSSDGFDKHRNKSHPFSDMGYGSTNSVSSDSSSGDNVFVESPTKIPGVKFVKDTSCYWYKPNITRDQAINLLKNASPGTFVIRDSQSFPGAFGLAVKVVVPPAHAIKKDMSREALKAELVRHFLIESTKKGCKLKGCAEEPIFGSLSAFVYQHTITPLALPLTLTMPTEDLVPNEICSKQKESESQFAKGSAGSLVFLGSVGVEMLTGPSAVQKTVETLFKPNLDNNSFTSVGFKVSPQGFTVTDNCRKMFFRRHFALSSILYCGIDPLDKRWDLKSSSDYGQKSRAFGIVLRTTGGVHNECHIFAECTKEWTSNILVNVINRYMSHKSS